MRRVSERVISSALTLVGVTKVSDMLDSVSKFVSTPGLIRFLRAFVPLLVASENREPSGVILSVRAVTALLVILPLVDEVITSTGDTFESDPVDDVILDFFTSGVEIEPVRGLLSPPSLTAVTAYETVLPSGAFESVN